MVSLNASNSNDDLTEMLRRVEVERERIIVNRDGKPAAALIPIEDLEWLEEIEDKIDNEMADRALAEGGPTIPYEVIRREMGLHD